MPTAHVATITLNRPDALNTFNRTMCEEMAEAWRIVKLDDSVHAVVLRAAGNRAFSAGLDVKTPYGQPDNVWNHEDPGEALSPKWQKMWKPVVCAVQGMCTAGAFYFVNEADVVICSDDATFFDSHVSAGLVCALEPIGLMRRVGLGETLRIALMGNDERVSADTALRIGLVSEVVDRGPTLGARPRDRRDDRRQTTVGHAGHREGDLGVAGQALPGGTGAGPDLHPAGKSARQGRTRPTRRGPASPSRGSGDARSPAQPADRRRAGPCSPTPPRSSTTANGRRGDRSATLARRIESLRSSGERARSGSCCATGPPTWRRSSACCWPAATVVVINPSRGDDRTRADIEALDLPLIIGDSDDLATLVAPAPEPTVMSIIGPERATRSSRQAARPTRRQAGPVSRCGC